jgi:hypothetical protein
LARRSLPGTSYIEIQMAVYRVSRNPCRYSTFTRRKRRLQQSPVRTEPSRMPSDKGSKLVIARFLAREDYCEQPVVGSMVHALWSSPVLPEPRLGLLLPTPRTPDSIFALAGVGHASAVPAVEATSAQIQNRASLPAVRTNPPRPRASEPAWRAPDRYRLPLRLAIQRVFQGEQVAAHRVPDAADTLTADAVG